MWKNGCITVLQTNHMKIDSWTDGKRTYTQNSTLCRNKVTNYTRVQLNNRLHQSHSAVTIVPRDNSSKESTKQQFAQWTVVSQSFRLTTWRLLKVIIGIAWFMVSNLYRYRSLYTPTFPLVGLLACTWSWWHGELAVGGGDSWRTGQAEAGLGCFITLSGTHWCPDINGESIFCMWWCQHEIATSDYGSVCLSRIAALYYRPTSNTEYNEIFWLETLARSASRNCASTNSRSLSTRSGIFCMRHWV